MGYERCIALFGNGRSHAVRIRREFELPGSEAIIRKGSGRLLIESGGRRANQLEVLAARKPPDDPFPDIAC